MWMNSREHTAQLTTEAAAKIQQQFNEGRVNVVAVLLPLSLVDVGELETVF